VFRVAVVGWCIAGFAPKESCLEDKQADSPLNKQQPRPVDSQVAEPADELGLVHHVGGDLHAAHGVHQIVAGGCE
jgi:hypothetical protein